MGLDVIAYEGIGKFLGDSDQYDTKDNVFLSRNPPGFSDVAPEIRHDGYYKILGKVFRFRAGSYGGYNEWREWLSEAFVGVFPKEIWENPKKFEGKPFVELINFSDSEGVLGKEVCYKLKKDFEDAVIPDTTTQYYVNIFGNFSAAFDLASSVRGGVVQFT